MSGVRERRIPLERLRGKAEFVSLQQEVRPADRDALEARPGIRHFGAELEDFADARQSRMAEWDDVLARVGTDLAGWVAAA